MSVYLSGEPEAARRGTYIDDRAGQGGRTGRMGSRMTQRYDVVIVGGGAIGSAIAYFLANQPAFDGTILVVERDPTYRQASSALSASSIRQQFSTEANIKISQFGIDFLRRVGQLLALGDDVPDIALHERGYLFLASPTGAAALASNHRLQRACGAEVALMDVESLGRRFPWMSSTGLAAATLGLNGEGWFDGYSLLQAFKRKAIALGASYRRAAVSGLERRGQAIEAVRLDDGTRIACATVVNAAGPRARLIAEMAGLALPVEARKRCVFVFDARTRIADCPLVIDPSGVWFRPEGELFICGCPPPAGIDAETFDLEVDYFLFDDIIWPALAARVPAFAAVKVVNAWAGHYEFNTFDQNAILGPHPDVPNFVLANGFSGHGLQQSPAVGRAIAELIAFGGYRTLDLAAFAIERVLESRPLREANVV